MATIVDGYKAKWIYAEEKYIAVAAGNDISDWDEVMANAHLISAAPDLLAKLQEAVEDRQCSVVCDGPHEGCPCWYCTSCAAITKAKGASA